MDNKAKVIDKIRKLLALSKSPNEHEAELALTKAMELMAQHDMEIDDLEAKTVGERDVPNDDFVLPDWKGWMAVLVADAFDTHVFTMTEWDKSKKAYKKQLKIVGTEVDTALATYVYLYVVAAMENKSREYQYQQKQAGNRAKPSELFMGHIQGMYNVLKPKIQAFAAARRRKAENEVSVTGITGKELIKIKKDAIQEYIDTLKLRPGQSKRFRTASSAEIAGRESGASVDIHDAIAQHEDRKYIGNPRRKW